MNESLEKRKRELAEHLIKEYNKKPKWWWPGKTPDYQTTWEAGNRNREYRSITDERIVRYDLKGALTGSALFLFIVSCMEFFTSKQVYMSLYMGVIVGLAMLITVCKEIKRKPKIILNQDGIWLHILDQTIPWKNIAASFIKKTEDGDSTAYHLVLHYYLEKYDTFAVTEYKLDCLDIKTKDLASEIECRKIIAYKS
ncbi:MAG: hypothetical protein QM791_18880 [Ferruginibacter sp.]